MDNPLFKSQKGSLPPADRIGAYIKRMEKEGVARVKMFLVITVAYLIFWGPLFLVTLFNWSWEWVDAKKSMAHEVKVLFSGESLRIKITILRPGGAACGIRPLLCQPFSPDGAA